MLNEKNLVYFQASRSPLPLRRVWLLLSLETLGLGEGKIEQASEEITSEFGNVSKRERRLGYKKCCALVSVTSNLSSRSTSTTQGKNIILFCFVF